MFGRKKSIKRKKIDKGISGVFNQAKGVKDIPFKKMPKKFYLYALMLLIFTIVVAYISVSAI